MYPDRGKPPQYALFNDVDENFLNLQEEVPLAKLGWVDSNDDELMKMTTVFQILDLEGYTPVNCPSNYDMVDLKNI
eukprot:491532-Ditylum_brightwellii.AAC.1